MTVQHQQQAAPRATTPPPIPPTGVEVTATHGNGWSLRTRLAGLTVAVNGTPMAGGWGTHFVPLPPGRHLVRVWFSDMWYGVVQPREVIVDLEPGRVARVAYHAPFGLFSTATIRPIA